MVCIQKTMYPTQKPITNNWRPALTRLPRLMKWRLLFRQVIHFIFRFFVWALADTRVEGMEKFPERGPVLIVINHLGDAEAILALAYFPVLPDGLAKVELYDFPILGKIMDLYGVVWVHRGRPDRRALRAAIRGIEEGRVLVVAPEGRQSVTGGLEEGTGGAAYIALKTNAPILPITFTGTENEYVYGSLRRFRRPQMTMTIGEVFYLDSCSELKTSIRKGTEQIMLKLAEQLPNEYRGVYL